MTTLVCPVHNEAEMLPVTLNSLYNVGADEMLFLLDRCNDLSEKIIKRKAAKEEAETRLIRVNGDEGNDWGFRGGFLRRKAYAMAKHNTILNVSADIALDPAIGEHAKLVPKYGLVSFGYLEKPWNLQEFLRILISELTPVHGLAGLMAFSRKAWNDTEDIEDLKKISKSEDTHLHLAIRSKYPTKHINTRSLHLRPNETKREHYSRGRAQYQLLHDPAWKAFAHSLIMLRPAVFAGYMHARSVDKQ